MRSPYYLLPPPLGEAYFLVLSYSSQLLCESAGYHALTHLATVQGRIMHNHWGSNKDRHRLHSDCTLISLCELFTQASLILFHISFYSLFHYQNSVAILIYCIWRVNLLDNVVTSYCFTSYYSIPWIWDRRACCLYLTLVFYPRACPGVILNT